MQSLPQSASLMKKWKQVFWSHCGSETGMCQASRRDWATRDSSPEIWALPRAAEQWLSHTYLRGRLQPSIRSLPSINLGSSSDILCLLIRGRLGRIRLLLSGFCLRSEQATKPLTFHLAEASMLEKSWQFIHFAPSRSQLMSDWWDPPSLMLYSSESALLGKKFYPSKLKRNISASSC